MFKTRAIRSFSDEELVNSFRKHGTNLFLEELFGRYIRFVFLISMKYLKDEEQAKDNAMEVFEKLTTDLKRFEIKNFKSWLHAVTKNACLMQLRSAKKTVSLDDDERIFREQRMEIHAELHHEHVNNKEIQLDRLNKAINTLTREQKQCIELFYLCEKSYKEVVDVTGYTMNQVKSFIQNGKRNLKNYLETKGDILLIVFSILYFKL